MVLKELVSSNKKLVTDNNLILYKVFIPVDEETLNIRTDAELMYLSKESAIEGCINATTNPSIDGVGYLGTTMANSKTEWNSKIKQITIVSITIPVKDNKDVEVVSDLPDTITLYNPDTNSLVISLKNFKYTIDVNDYKIDSIDITVDKNEIKRVTNCVLIDYWADSGIKAKKKSK